MQGSWNHNRAYYRCKFPAEYAVSEEKHPKTIYVREESLTPAIDTWLAQLFDEQNIEDTCTALANATGQDVAEQNRIAAARKTLRECDTKLARYREALEAGTDLCIVNEWIAEVQATRRNAEASSNATPTQGGLSEQQIRELVAELKGFVEILSNAAPEDRKAVYRELNLAVVYHDDGSMQVSAGPSSPAMSGNSDPCTYKSVGGATSTQSTRAPWTAELVAA